MKSKILNFVSDCLPTICVILIVFFAILGVVCAILSIDFIFPLTFAVVATLFFSFFGGAIFGGVIYIGFVELLEYLFAIGEHKDGPRKQKLHD